MNDPLTSSPRHEPNLPSPWVRTARALHVMASLRNTAIGALRKTGWNNIAGALRRHARNPQRAITCALNC